MIIYGTGSGKIAEEKIKANCPNCDTANSTTMLIYQRHAHVFWIPLFPAGRIVATQCSHCNQVIEHKGFTDRFREEYQMVKHNAKTPWWNFIGLIIIACIVAGAIYQSNEDDKLTADMVQNPKVGDLFEIRSADKEYALLKVAKVAGDSIYILENEYTSNQAGSIDDLNKKPFMAEAYAVHKSALKKLQDNDDITNTQRP